VSSIAYPISLRSRTTIYVKTTTNKPRFYLPHILRIWASGNFCVLYPSCTPENTIFFFPSSRNRKRGALPLFRPYLIGKVFHILYHSYSDYTPSLHIAHRGGKNKNQKDNTISQRKHTPPLFLVWFVAPISFLAKISYSHIRGGLCRL